MDTETPTATPSATPTSTATVTPLPTATPYPPYTPYPTQVSSLGYSLSSGNAAILDLRMTSGDILIAALLFGQLIALVILMGRNRER